MKINIGNILSTGDNLKLIKDSINVLEYKNTIDEVVYELNRGCNLADDIFYRISFPPSSIETLNPLANLIFVKGYIYTDLFPYLYDNLKYYYEQLESIYIEEFIENTEKEELPEEESITAEEAEELLWQIKHQGYTKSGMRKAGQYCIQLYENDIEKLRGAAHAL